MCFCSCLSPQHLTLGFYDSILMRPTTRTGSFHLGIIGRSFDPMDLTDPTKFVKFFHENTGREDIVFKSIRTLTYWKSASCPFAQAAKRRLTSQ